MFNKDFFQEHQKALLWVANNRLFSWLLGLNRLPKPIGQQKWMRITPNALSYVRNDGQFETVSFTRPRFAEALVFNLSPFIASQDFKLMTRMFSPAKAVGLATMFLAMQKDIPLVLATVSSFYSNSTGDGSVYVSQAVAPSQSTWDTVHDATSGTARSATLTSSRVSFLSRSAPLMFIERAFLPFDSSDIPDTDEITAGSINIYSLNTPQDRTGATNAIVAVKSTQTSGTAFDGDTYSKVENTAFASVALSSHSANGYVAYNLNAAGLLNISKTAYSKFALRMSDDASDTFVNNYADSELVFSSTDATGTAQDPYLSATHAPAVTAFKQSMMNVL